MSNDESAARELMEERKVAWRRRPRGGLGIWDTEDAKYWLKISDSVTTDVSDNQTPKLSQLTPHKAFNLIKEHINPLQNGVIRNKDGTFDCMIPRTEAELYINSDTMGNIKVKVERHQYRNRIRGTIYHPDIKLMPEEEILIALKDYDVTEIKKKQRYNPSSNSRETTGELILHFDRQILPTEINLDYLLLRVREYIPKPPMCGKCYQIGEHITDECKEAVELCGWCAKRKHLENRSDKCKAASHCRNCEGDHPAWDRNCPRTKYLEEILAVKEKFRYPYPKAKALVDERRKASKRNSQMFQTQPTQQQPETTHNSDLEAKVEHLTKTLQATVQHLTESFNSVIQQLSGGKADLLPPMPTIEQYTKPTSTYINNNLVNESEFTSDSDLGKSESLEEMDTDAESVPAEGDHTKGKKVKKNKKHPVHGRGGHSQKKRAHSHRGLSGINTLPEKKTKHGTTERKPPDIQNR